MKSLALFLLLSLTACFGQIEPQPLCHTGAGAYQADYAFRPVDGGTESYEGCDPGDRCTVGTDAGYLYGVCK